MTVFYVAFLPINSCFFSRLHLLTSYSRFLAVLQSPHFSQYTNLTGFRERVYLHHAVVLCSLMRRATSFAMPVYSVLSRHSAI